MELLTPEVIAAGIGAVSTWGIVAFGERNHKRKNPWETPPQSPSRKRIKTSFDMPITRRRVAFSGRRKRRFRKRTFRRPAKRQSRARFRRRVKNVVLRMSEAKKQDFPELAQTFAAGDGTTMVMRIFAPWQAMFTQSLTSSGMIGSKVHLMKLYMRVHLQNVVAGDIHCQYILVASDFMMDLTAAGTALDNRGQQVGNTTTVSTNPTQVFPQSNIAWFDINGTQQFAGISPVSKFNGTQFRFLKKWDFKIPGFGQAGTDGFIDRMLTYNFNRPVQIQEVDSTIDGVPRFFGNKNGKGRNEQYYMIFRAWSQTATSVTQIGNHIHRTTVTYRDI